MKLALWTLLPNHYIRAFVEGIRRQGADVSVRYWQAPTRDRLDMGWAGRDVAGEEEYVDSPAEPLRGMVDWRQRIHMVAGYRDVGVRTLVRWLCGAGVPWTHWSERSKPGLRWWSSAPLKFHHARLVNDFGLGAFGIGSLALDDFARWGMERTRLVSVPYCVDRTDTGAATEDEIRRFAAGRTAFVFVGQLCHRKGTDLLAHAFVSLLRMNDNCALVIAGPTGTPFARACQSTLSAGVASGNVLFTGAVEPANVQAVMRACQVLVLPSRYDGWGVVVNEAAANGLALITSDEVGAHRDLIEHGVNGYVVPGGSREGLRRAMGEYLRDPALASQHGEASLVLSARVDPDNLAARVIATLERWLPQWSRRNPNWVEC